MRPFCSGREQVWRGSYQSSGRRKEVGVQPPRRNANISNSILIYMFAICDRVCLDLFDILYLMFSLITNSQSTLPLEVGDCIADGDHVRHQGDLMSQP